MQWQWRSFNNRDSRLQLPNLTFFYDGSCAASKGSGQAASDGRSAMHPVASKNACSGRRCLWAMRRLNREVFPLLSSSAHVFCSPAKCVTSNSMRRRVAIRLPV